MWYPLLSNVYKLKHAKGGHQFQANGQKTLQHYVVCLFQAGGSLNTAARNISQNSLGVFCLSYRNAVPEDRNI